MRYADAWVFPRPASRHSSELAKKRFVTGNRESVIRKALRGSWLQSGGFLLIGLFGAVTLTSASVTAVVLLAIILLALALSLVFERRSFCRYLCPVGGFIGMLQQLQQIRNTEESLAAQLRTLGFLEAHSVASLATAGANGPWAAAVFYASRGFTLYFLSAPTTRHSRNLAADPRVNAVSEDVEVQIPDVAIRAPHITVHGSPDAVVRLFSDIHIRPGEQKAAKSKGAK